MNSLYINLVRKNRIVFLAILLLFSLMSAYIPHGLPEMQDYYDCESLFRQVANNRWVTNFRKLLKNIRATLLKIFVLLRIPVNTAILTDARLALFGMRISKMSISQLLSLLCFYFHGSKFKDKMKHSELLPLMTV